MRSIEEEVNVKDLNCSLSESLEKFIKKIFNEFFMENVCMRYFWFFLQSISSSQYHAGSFSFEYELFAVIFLVGS
jgi:hypothetical protein